MTGLITKYKQLPDDIQKGVLALVAMPFFLFAMLNVLHHGLAALGIIELASVASHLKQFSLFSTVYFSLFAQSLSATFISLAYFGLLHLIL